MTEYQVALVVDLLTEIRDQLRILNCDHQNQKFLELTDADLKKVCECGKLFVIPRR